MSLQLKRPTLYSRHGGLCQTLIHGCSFAVVVHYLAASHATANRQNVTASVTAAISASSVSGFILVHPSCSRNRRQSPISQFARRTGRAPETRGASMVLWCHRCGRATPTHLCRTAAETPPLAPRGGRRCRAALAVGA